MPQYDTEWEVQEAIYAKLLADAELSTLLQTTHRDSGTTIYRIYDHVPQETTYPYVVIADMSLDEWGSKNWEGSELHLHISVWSRGRGRKECADIFGMLRRILHYQPLIVTGHYHILTQLQSTEIALDPDGITSHGIARYHIIVQNEEEAL